MSKVVLITGASSGIGNRTALMLAKQGYTVYAATRAPEKISVNIKNLHVLKLDITNSDSIKCAVEHIKVQHGKIDVLLNNAGYALVSSVEDATEEEMYQQFNINVFSIFRLCKFVTPLMRQQDSGVIINISSFLGKVGLPLFSFYNSTKYAVEGITDSLRYELKDFNIRVHSILPGFFQTNFAKSNLVMNDLTFDIKSPYSSLVKNLVPNIVEQINNGDDTLEAALLVQNMIENEDSPARATVGEKARQFLPMRKELSDEDFERRVREYYNLNG